VVNEQFANHYWPDADAAGQARPARAVDGASFVAPFETGNGEPPSDAFVTKGVI
jgi:hypothetical protein